MVHLSPGAREIQSYPFEELDRRKRVAIEEGRKLIDMGVGDPREETPVLIRDALVAALEPTSSYPRAAGLPELREAIAGWVGRRFGVNLDPETNVIPTLGSKELIFSLASLLADRDQGRDTVVITAPGYTIPERGARYAGAEVVRLPLRASDGFFPDLDSIRAELWDRTAILWLNYPNNPTGAVAPAGAFARAASLARAHGFVLASDEAYSELWFEDGPPASALETGVTNVLSINTLSKRSSMTGYRSGFAAGDPELIDALKRLRPSVGVTPQEFVQRASVAAWNDESHVEKNRLAYAEKREAIKDVLLRNGVEVSGSVATFYLWVKVPGGRLSLEWAIDLLDRGGLVVAPGSFFGPEGEGYARLAMVPNIEDCLKAAEILDRVLGEAR